LLSLAFSGSAPELDDSAPLLDVGATTGASAPLTLLPQDDGDESPACLDGSPYGFYFVPSTTKSTKWTINIQGGGWCYDEVLCYERSKTRLGSSTLFPPSAGCGCMNTVDDGLDRDCNCVFLPYGDGASFSGYRAEPWSVPDTPGANLTFRGIKNLDATVEWALAHGLKDATQLVVTGGSAGGLSTFLHADRVIAAAKKGGAPLEKAWAAPVVGYFLDHDNYAHSSGTPNQPSWKQDNYTDWMKYIYAMQNLTFGSDGGLTAACRAKHPDAPHLCFMSPHMEDVVQSPLFVFNSKYDAWQLANELQTKWATAAEQKAVLQYGEDFLAQFEPLKANPKNGAMITSCICHGCPWTELALEGKTTYEHYAAWASGKDTGAAAFHIDPRTPNGDGNITYSQCSKFP